ncbi:MAG: DNRLRE domain-containing protein [candidate division WOR-3 bacterium]
MSATFRYRFLAVLLFCFCLLPFLNCNTRPVGFDLIGSIPEEESIELPPDTIDSYAKFIPLSTAPYLLLGKDNQYESRILLKFALKDSALDSVTAVHLILYPQGSYPQKFLCYPCSTDWSGSGVTWRMTDSLNQWVNPGGDYWHLLLCEGSLVKDSTVLQLNRDYLPTLVRHSYGIILLPVDTGFTTIVSLEKTSSSPRIVFSYLNGKKRTYYPTEDTHIVDSTNLGIYPEEILVGSSVAFRTYIHFSLESIPPAATVTRAELKFKPLTVYRREDTIRLGVHRLTESYRTKGKYARFAPTAAGITRYVPLDTDTVVHLEITSLVQEWVSRPDSSPNYGLLLTAEPEWLKPFRIKIFRSGPNSPKLKVSYLYPPEDRFSR